MDKDLYEMMQKILEIKKTNFTEDIRYLGTITSNESTPTGSVQVTRDIFMLIDQMPDGSAVQKFYDGDGNFVAGSSNLDNKIYPSATFAEEDLSFMGQLEDLSKTSGISLNEFDNYLENIAKTLGVSKEDILSMSTVDLNQKVATKGKIQLGLDEDDEENEQSTINADILNNISKKQEIDLNQKVDDDHTLAEILGVPAGSKLISVYSDRIENNPNTTRFSHLIQTPDGKIEPASMLKQVGGKTSDKTIYQTNRDGSKVEKLSVDSTYSIDSPIVDNAIITARFDSMGYIEVGYGQTDRTSHRDAFTQELETERTRYTTKEVRDEFSENKGIDNVQDKMDEIKMHEGHDHNLSLEDADGDLSTGEAHDIAIERIKASDSMISEVFTDNEISERLETMIKENPDKDFEEIVELTQKDLSEDASRMHIR